MDLMFIILKAMAIGSLGSLPVGPIVMLSVQRSIVGGHKAGMQCALGAILSDTVFAAMALFAVSATSRLLGEYSSLIQICGGLIIAGVGVGMLIGKNDLNDRCNSRRKGIADTGKSLVMGFSNPGSFFWILAALTATGMSSDNINLVESVCVVAGVFAGSLIYWQCLTYIVSKKGSGFSTSTMFRINKLFGVAILIFGLYFLLRGIIKSI